MKKKVFLSFFLLALVTLIIISTQKTTAFADCELENNNKNIYTFTPISTSTEVSLSKINSSESVDLYDEKEQVVEVFNSSTMNIYLTSEDINLMSKIVYAESKGEPYEGKVAVASVILNRVIDSHFPNTIEGVIKQKNAFSCVKNGEISVTPTEECYNAVIEAIRGNDPTGNALYFYNPKIATCSWMKNIEKHNEKPIGQHVFFEI